MPDALLPASTLTISGLAWLRICGLAYPEARLLGKLFSD